MTHTRIPPKDGELWVFNQQKNEPIKFVGASEYYIPFKGTGKFDIFFIWDDPILGLVHMPKDEFYSEINKWRIADE